jgi:single-strand DNA-binding protein
MLTLTGNGRLTRDVELRSTRSGKSVARHRLGGQRPPRPQGRPVYVDLILWEGQAEAAAEHLVKGQAVAFSGRFEPRQYTTRADSADGGRPRQRHPVSRASMRGRRVVAP